MAYALKKVPTTRILSYFSVRGTAVRRQIYVSLIDDNQPFGCFATAVQCLAGAKATRWGIWVGYKTVALPVP